MQGSESVRCSWRLARRSYSKARSICACSPRLRSGPVTATRWCSNWPNKGLSLVSEGSIYPLLSRLQQHGYIQGYLVASRDGPKRKYYRLLPAGAKQLEQWRTEWEAFAQAVEHILKGAQYDEESRPAHSTP